MQYGEKCMDGEIKGVSVGNHSCLLLRKASAETQGTVRNFENIST